MRRRLTTSTECPPGEYGGNFQGIYAAPCDGGADGWQFAKHADGSDDLGRVVLCGPACEAVKADPTTVVDVILGCQVLE